MTNCNTCQTFLEAEDDFVGDGICSQCRKARATLNRLTQELYK